MPDDKPVDNPEGLPQIDYSSKNIPLEKVIELYKKGLSQVEIARFFGCSKQAINHRIAPYKEDIDGLQAFIDNKADVYAFHSRRILNRLTNEDIEKASGYQKVGMVSLLHDKEAQQRTGFTQVIGYADLSKTVAEVIKAKVRLQQELGIQEAEIVHGGESEPDFE